MYILEHESGKFVALDYASGGYPYLVDDWPSAKIWRDEQEVRRYATMFQKEPWKLFRVDLNKVDWIPLEGQLGGSTECVHTRHCCVLHGCKYGDETCPVVLKQKHQDHKCEQCYDSNYWR